ncbi:MAG: hypothetical protein AAFQ11_02045 [Pseudomonadota bacterium]
MQVNDNNLGQAIDLLEAGFPNRTRQFWETGIARLVTLDAHARDGLPIGHFLMSSGQPVGVALSAISYTSRFIDCQAKGVTSPKCVAKPSAYVGGNSRKQSTLSAERQDDRPRCRNLASWYIEPAHRWKISLLLRDVLSDRAAVYTDLTPTADVQKILKSLGFQALNDGVKVVNTAVRALRTERDTRVQEWQAASQAEAGPTALPQTETFDVVARDHVGYGCRVVELLKSDGRCRLILKPTRVKHTPAVQVIYCDDTAILDGSIGALSRWLVARGYLALIVDVACGSLERTNVSQIVMPERRRRFVRNAFLEGQTDYTYSELALFDL